MNKCKNILLTGGSGFLGKNIINPKTLAHIISVGEIYNIEHFPVGTVIKQEANKTALAKWWSKRSIPASREGIDEVLDELNLTVPQELLEKSYGLSLSDQYWISPKDNPLNWSKVNFFDNEFSEDLGDLLFGYAKKSDSLNLSTPDNSSDGQLKKRWKLVEGWRVLIKCSNKPYYQEALSEVIASLIADKLNIPHIPYKLAWEKDVPYSVCKDFITRDTELVSAQYVLLSSKKPNDLSTYEFYIKCGEDFGIKNIRTETEKMIVLDFLIANEDRHFNNFGLIRNASTLEWIGVAPIFDCGTSLWHSTLETQIKPKSTSLPSKPFKKIHSEQLKLVKDFSWLDLKKLEGIESEINKILSESKYISEERRNILCSAISERIDLLSDIILENQQIQSQNQDENDFGMTMM